MAKGTLFGALALAWLANTVNAMVSSGRQGYGLIGFGIEMYVPPCAYACKGSIGNPLHCDDAMSGDHGGMVKRMSGMGGESPSPHCYATNTPFLQSVAYCISKRCQQVDVWELERWWKRNIAGRKTVQPIPKWTYQETLETLSSPPTSVVPSEDMLHTPTLVDDETYQAAFIGNNRFQINEKVHNTYALVVLCTCFLIPVMVSWARMLPLPKAHLSRFNASFVYAPLLGVHHQRPLWGLCQMPTRGQALFLSYIVFINIMLCAVGYTTEYPNSWYSSSVQQIGSYVANRTGILSPANICLLVLYSSRNSVLIWLTGWDRSTFLLLHRWVAWIATLQACIHSAFYLWSYLDNGGFASDVKLAYWIWGIISTLALVIIIPFAQLPLRARMYQLFYPLHLVLALLAILGYYYHIYERFGRQWGYELWGYVAFALWASDWLIRAMKMASNRLPTATVTIVDEDYVRLDVPKVRASGYAHVYFPTLGWKVWENHLFSNASSLKVNGRGGTHAEDTGPAEKAAVQSVRPVESEDSSPTRSGRDRNATHAQYETGLTFFVRTHKGMTRLLRDRKTLPVLVESSYGHSLINNLPERLAAYPTLVCIAGGVGITAIAPLLAGHLGQRKLYWGVRTPTLVNALDDIFANDVSFAGLERQVSVGARLDLATILEKEVCAEVRAQQGTAIVVSGPAEMSDVVRVTVARLAMRYPTANVAFIETSYSW